MARTHPPPLEGEATIAICWGVGRPHGGSRVGWPAGRSTPTSSNPICYFFKKKFRTNVFSEVYLYIHMGSVRKSTEK